jgi:hypothetical protein
MSDLSAAETGSPKDVFNRPKAPLEPKVRAKRRALGY